MDLSCSDWENAQMIVYPPPKRFRHKNGWRRRNTNVVQLTHPVSPRLTRVLRTFCNRNQLHLQLGASKGATFLEIVQNKAPPESYALTSNTNGLTLDAADDSGVFYGLGTLQQILDQSKTRLQHFEIKDAPDFSRRGVMLDISRCKVPTIATLFEIIDALATLKFNQLQLYVEHTFTFTNHPVVWRNASALTPSQMLQLQKYCSDRFIELIPSLNSFGHFERWLRHPPYHKFAECPDGFVHPLTNQSKSYGSTLKPNRQSLQLLEELYDEYLPLFDSPYFNVGGDEPWELGRGWSAPLCKEQGTEVVYLSFMQKINRLVKKRGRKTMFWADIILQHPKALNMLPNDLTALIWGYEASHPFRKECAQLAEIGAPFYVCPGTSSWNGITGRFSNAKRNLSTAARNGLSFGAEGYLVTDWGDNGHHQYLPISYPGFTIGACHAWNHNAAGNIDVADAIHRIWTPEHKQAAKMVVELGKLPEISPVRLKNASLFNHLLFWDMQAETPVSRQITEKNIGDCLKRLTQLKEEIEVAPNALIYRELTNALDMGIHSLERLSLFRGYDKSTDQARKHIRNIIDQHRLLWRARNRTGGLAESISHLAKAEKSL
ncbi:MAG TPA: glycoside hydrolase [Gammaproteobacteria bacterium]|nr:glycoside hydrolase [Gammaproteobacteria bacterium]|tara:strand:+ start:1705 stop:3516 length:1812 start_codon:yes stop_codon:yes gene_type:complete